MKCINKTIWIINNYASHLEARHLELSKVFADNGYTVAVITSSFHHGEKRYLYEDDIKAVQRSEGVYYFYLKIGPEYGNNGGKRILNMFNFCRAVDKYKEDIESIAGTPSFIIGSSASSPGLNIDFIFKTNLTY